jgi:hypothetical protein
MILLYHSKCGSYWPNGVMDFDVFGNQYNLSYGDKSQMSTDAP